MPGAAPARPTIARWRVRAVTAARALGDAERLALAVLGHARPGGFMANDRVVDQLLIALYEEADAALAGAETITRARILAQLAVELIYTPQRDRRLALAREAVAIARRTGDRPGLAGVLHTILLAINDPFTLAERRALSAELCELAAEIGGLELHSRRA